METEKITHPSDMDAVLAYRNLLAAEDHLDELIFRAVDSEEKFTLRAMLADTINLRDEIMPAEHDPTKHCLVKHYAIAYEAIRERWKDLMTDELYWTKRHAYDLLINALEMLWGRQIITCERCDYERTARGNTERTAPNGQPRGAIQTTGVDREPSVQSVSGARQSGSGADSSEPQVDGWESGSITHHDWDRYGKDSSVGSEDGNITGRLREG